MSEAVRTFSLSQVPTASRDSSKFLFEGCCCVKAKTWILFSLICWIWSLYFFLLFFLLLLTLPPLGDAMRGGQFAWNLNPKSQSRFLGQHWVPAQPGTTMTRLVESLAPTLASSQDSTPQMHACVQCFGKRVCNACIWIIASWCDTTPARLANSWSAFPLEIGWTQTHKAVGHPSKYHSSNACLCALLW
jgi:hypothetical protein